LPFISLLRFIEFFSYINEIVTISASGVFNYHFHGFARVFMATVLLNFRVSFFH